jgi:hypothetical protein
MERESCGRERWLSEVELARFMDACPVWWPLFGVRSLTGARLGEAQELRGGCAPAHHRTLIHEGDRRVKPKEAVRDLPIPPALEGRWRAT